jgi:hypothetical protein
MMFPFDRETLQTGRIPAPYQHACYLQQDDSNAMKDLQGGSTPAGLSQHGGIGMGGHVGFFQTAFSTAVRKG